MSDPSSPPAAPATDPATEPVSGEVLELAVGLDPGHRFRCTACGNVTRFDVVASLRTRGFHHFDLGGRAVVEDEEVLDRQVESVTCRWCGRGDGVRAELAPTAGSE